MRELGLKEEQNPLIYATPFGYALYTINQVVSGSLDKMANAEISSFNEKFNVYQGSQVGMNVQVLIETVIGNNYAQTGGPLKPEDINSAIKKHKVSVNGMLGKEELQEYANKIEITKQYNVTMEKDAEGYINSIKISE